MARARTNPETAVATDKPPTPAHSPTVNGGDVARRAYDLYLARGREPGHDVEDWLQAERELQAVDTHQSDPQA